MKLDDFMSWVKLRKEVECSKIMTWYSDRYKELCAQRAKLLEKNPEGKEKLMGAWTQCYEDALKRLNMGDEKNEGLRHYFKRQIKMKRRTADFCKDYAEDHKSRADKDVGCNLAEIRATVERTHKKLPLDLSLVLPTTLAFEYIDIDEIKQNAKEMAKSFVKQHIDLYLYCSPVHTTEQFDELSKNQAEIMRKLSALVRRGFNF